MRECTEVQGDAFAMPAVTQDTKGVTNNITPGMMGGGNDGDPFGMVGDTTEAAAGGKLTLGVTTATPVIRLLTFTTPGGPTPVNGGGYGLGRAQNGGKHTRGLKG